MKSTFVSVTIPTLNSGQTIRACLLALNEQTLKPGEVIIVDGGSADDTVQIARSLGATVQILPGGILLARDKGVSLSSGKFVLLLDSDQILKPDALDRAISMMSENIDMLVLEEESQDPKGFIQKLFSYDRRFIHLIGNLNPETSVLLPRFFKRSILVEAFAHIPVKELSDLVAEDHAILFYEVSKISKKIAMLSGGVAHIEKKGAIHLVRHYFRFGQESGQTKKNPVFALHYAPLMRQKRRPRGFLFSHPLLSIASNLLILLKAVPYFAGEWTSGKRASE